MRFSLVLLLAAFAVYSSPAAEKKPPAPDPNKFELRPYAIEIPEWPDPLVGYELLTVSNRFQFAPPPEFRTRFDPARRMVMMTSLDGRCAVSFQLTTNFFGALPDAETLTEHARRRVPGSRGASLSNRVIMGRRSPVVVLNWGNPPAVQRTEYAVCLDANYCLEFRIDMFENDAYQLRNMVGNCLASFVRTPPPRPAAPARE